MAGVSRTTVSFVLNDRYDAHISDETRRRVREAAETLGYHVHAPARQLAAGASRTLALVLRQSPEHVASDALLPDTLRGLAAAARIDGYRVLVEPMPPGSGSFEILVRSQHADGLVISGPLSEDDDLQRLADEGFPVVIQGTIVDAPVASVDIDNVVAARAAVRHLIAQGHRRIACVTNASLAYAAAKDRLAGYRQALDEAGIEFDERLVAEGDFDPPSGHGAMTRILAAGVVPTAVFAASDVVAFGVFGALREAGHRVPADVSIVGFDDIPVAAFTDPPLTTIRTPAFELGEAAGRMLVERLAGRTTESRTVLPAELVVRASTTRAPNGVASGMR